MADKPEKTQSFEKALARLEEIAAEMESGELGLEKMVAAFEEGQKLVKLCSSKLNEVEKKIEMLVKKSDGPSARNRSPARKVESGGCQNRGGGVEHTACCVPVAQLDRASDYGSEGYRFNSCQVRHSPATHAHDFSSPGELDAVLFSAWDNPIVDSFFRRGEPRGGTGAHGQPTRL